MAQYSQHFSFTTKHTTRPPRPLETGDEYHFNTPLDEMQQEIEDGKYIEYSNIAGNLYGTKFSEVQRVKDSGKICLVKLDKEACEKVRDTALRPKYLFIAPPDIDALEDRLNEKKESLPDGHPDKTKDWVQRSLSRAKSEADYGSAEGNFDKVLVNEVLEDAFGTMRRLFEAWYPHLLEEEEEGEGGEEGKEEGKQDEA